MVVIYGNVGEGVFQFTTQVGSYDSNLNVEGHMLRR